MDKKKLIKIIFYAIIIIGFIIGGYFGMKKLMENRPDPVVYESHEYNGFYFEYHEPLWKTNMQRGINLYTIYLRHSAKELDEIPIYGSLAQYGKITTKEGYSYLILDDWGVEDGNLAVATNEVGQQFRDVIGENIVTACSNEDPDKCYNFSKVVCEESEHGALYLTFGNETKIVANGNCVTITGENSTELVKATERLFYHWYGIIKNQ